MSIFSRKPKIDPNSEQEISRKRDIACNIIQKTFELKQTVVSILNDYGLVDKLIAKFIEHTEESLNSTLARLRLEKTPDNIAKAALVSNQIKAIYS